MELNKVVEDLPIVIGNAIWQQLQKAAETSKADVVLKGDLEISLPVMNIAVSLNHFLENDVLEKGLGQTEERGADPGAPETTESLEEKNDVHDTEVMSVEGEKEPSTTARKSSKPLASLKKVQEKSLNKKREQSPTLEELEESSDEFDPSGDYESDSDFEVTTPVLVAATPRSSNRLRIKTETLGKLDFSKGIERDPNLKIKSGENAFNDEREAETPVTSQSVQRKRGRPGKYSTGHDSTKGDSVNNFDKREEQSSMEPKLMENYLLETRIACQVCNRHLLGTRGAAIHVRSHKNMEVSLGCGLCNEVLINCEAMVAHLEQHQRGELEITNVNLNTVVEAEEKPNQTAPSGSEKSTDKSSEVQRRGRGRPRKYPKLETEITPAVAEETVEVAMKADHSEVLDSENALEHDGKLEEQNSSFNELDLEPNSKGNADLVKAPSEKDVSYLNETTVSDKDIHTCEICNKTFNRKSTLKEHTFTHTRNSAFKCQKCGRQFPRWYKLKQHCKLAHRINIKQQERGVKDPVPVQENKKGYEVTEEKPHQCSKCHKVFTSHARLHEHQFLHKKEARFYCHSCQGRMASFSKLERHLLIAHQTKITKEMYLELVNDFLPPEGCAGYYEVIKVEDDVSEDAQKQKKFVVSCEVCKEFTGTREEAVEHMKIHKDRFIHECEYCDEKFQFSSTIKYHQAFLHKDEFKHECVICKAKFGRVVDLALHSNKDHSVPITSPTPPKRPNRIKAFPCQQCGQVFKNPSRLRDHVWVKHDKKEKPYKCPQCPKRFIREDIMRDHMFVHNRISRYMCEKCGKAFKKPFELRQHRHLDDPWKCEICDKAFTTFNGYKVHMRKHTEVPSHMCRFCGAMFFFKGRLENHERTHTGEKPFTCDTCGAKYGDLYNFNKHKRSHVTPRHQCTLCEKNYQFKGQLKTHMLTHTSKSAPRERFKCEYCHKAYYRKEGLRKHQATHFDKTPAKVEDKIELFFQCNICESLYTNKADCIRCKNSHYQIANSVADVMASNEQSVDGTLTSTIMTDQEVTVDQENGQVLLVSLVDLQNMGDQFVISQDGVVQEAIRQIVIKPSDEDSETSQAVEIINEDHIAEIVCHDQTEISQQNQIEIADQDQVEVIDQDNMEFTEQMEITDQGQVEVINQEPVIEVMDHEIIEVINHEDQITDISPITE